MRRLLLLSAWIASAQAEPEQLDTIKDVFARLHSLLETAAARRSANPIDITVIVSFNREGAILGPSAGSPMNRNRPATMTVCSYRVAVMEALQRCTPLPFTEALGGAIAGRPFAVPFRTRKKPPPKPTEHRAWLTPKIL